MGRVESGSDQVEFGSGRVQVGSCYFIIFYPDLKPIRLNSGQKILTHTRPDRVMDRFNPN
jgi:hypothetical protein